MQALLALGVMVYGISVLMILTAQPITPRIPWINQQPGMVALEIGGDSERTGVYFFTPSANLRAILTDVGVADILSPERLREAWSNADFAVSLVLEQGGVGFREMGAVKRLALGLPINLNKATEEDLARVPGIGVKTASKIITLRQSKGRGITREDLQMLPGISRKKIQTFKSYLMP
jgi:competence ComEA-like helix-hairpin-helix protein